jgi:hypothetical protein
MRHIRLFAFIPHKSGGQKDITKEAFLPALL